MPVSQNNGTFQIRRQGLVVCVSATGMGPRAQTACEFLALQARDKDVPFKLCLPGWPEELEEFPDESFLRSNRIGERGRFITPVVEGFFSQLPAGEFDLFVLSEPEDYCDWEELLNVVFNQVHLLPEERLSGTTAEMENRLALLTRGRPLERVELSFSLGIPWMFPADWKVGLGEESLMLSTETRSARLDFEVKACGPERNVAFSLSFMDTSHVMEVETLWPQELPFSGVLKAEESRFMEEALRGFRSGSREHHCPRCGEKHCFPNTFRCDKSTTGPGMLRRRPLVFESMGVAAGECRYLLFTKSAKETRWAAVERAVTRLEGDLFLVIPSEGLPACQRVGEPAGEPGVVPLADDLFLPGEGYVLLKGG